MKFALLSLCLALVLSSCSKSKGTDKTTPVTAQFISGELGEVAKARGLSNEDLIASVKTYNPSGATEEYLAFFGTGVSGRVAVVGMPSMKILKYVAVFSSEPWQGYAFDDESKGIIKGSSREEIEYAFGDIGTPALSLTKGQHDGRSLFIADAANGRIGLLDLAEYEAKQIVTHPLFRNSNADLAVDSNTKYIAQTTANPEMLKKDNKLFSGATFWRFVEKEAQGHKIYFIDSASSFSVLLPAAPQSSPAMGKDESDGIMLSISMENIPQLNIIDWKLAESIVPLKSLKVNNHFTLHESTALKENVLKRIALPAGSERVIISGDGKYAAITNSKDSFLQLVEMKQLKEGKASFKQIDVGGASVDAAFTHDDLYVTVHRPSQLIRIGLNNKSVASIHPLNFTAARLMLPGADTNTPAKDYAVVMNLSPQGRFTPVGPQTGLSAHLLDIKQDKIQDLYDASIPQSTRLAAVAMSIKMNKPIFKYKIGTDPRSGLISNYKTASGKEKVLRFGNRVHVYATVIRSHITPDLIEVQQGDIVSIHITSNEQSRDQTHGFTIDTYNVHSSWEPGKSATVTFNADRAGVFPFYCTEFCSALHLEMQGYLLVKPTDKKIAQTDELMKLHQNPEMKSFFNYIKGE